MQDINTVSLSGNLTSEPRYYQINENRGVLNFQIANDRTSRRNGESFTYTNFFVVNVYGRQNLWLKEHLHCGMKVVLTGELIFSKWESKKDGTPRNKVEVNARNVIISSPFGNREKDYEEEEM